MIRAPVSENFAFWSSRAVSVFSIFRGLNFIFWLNEGWKRDPLGILHRVVVLKSRGATMAGDVAAHGGSPASSSGEDDVAANAGSSSAVEKSSLGEVNLYGPVSISVCRFSALFPSRPARLTFVDLLLG